MATPTPQPWKPNSRKDWWLKGPGIVVLLAAAGVVVAALALTVAPTGDPGDDIRVRVTSCELGEVAGTVGLEVTNSGSRARTVRIDLEYRDGGGRRVDTDTATVRDVQPGDTVVHDEPTLLNAAVTGQGSCIVTSVR